MSRSLWRFFAGPFFTLVTGICLLLIRHYLQLVALPGPVMFFPVLVGSYIGGMISGLVSAALSVGFVFLLLSDGGQLLVLSSDNLRRLIAMMLFSSCTAIAVGVSRMREWRASAKVTATYGQLASVCAALDEVDYAIMLLDRDLRVQFVNRAAYRNGGLCQRDPGEKPTLVDLLRELATTGTYPVGADKIDQFIAKSLDFFRSGKSGPADFRLSDGRIFRFRCNVLPDGGRLLIYMDVSDFVRNAEKLHVLAMTDGLTGLFNHAHFMREARREWNVFLRYRRSLSLLVVDVDSFKSVNDQFGHDVGDRVLSHIAMQCSEDRRRTDIVARMGGDEFAILMPETGLEDASTAAERLRQRLKENPLRLDDRELGVTVSIGVAEAQRGMRDFVELRKRADKALYEAKSQGRNRVVTAQLPLNISEPAAMLQPQWATPIPELVGLEPKSVGPGPKDTH